MTMRKRLLLGAAAGVVLLAAVVRDARADIPVIDVSALAEWVTQIANDAKAYALQGEQFLKQNQQYITQLQQYAQEIQLYENFFHNPTLGGALGLLTAAGLSSQLPINPTSMLSLVNGFASGGNGFSLATITGILGSLNGLANSAYATSHVYTPTDGSWASQQLIARGNGISGEQGATQTAYQELQTHLATLPALQTNLLAAQDTKSVLDASAQVQLQTAWNVNKAAQIQALQATYEAQRDSSVQRDNECLDENIEQFLSTSPVQLGGATGAGGACAPGLVGAP
jgi:conjugal transfer/entry exclusion protein